MTTNTSTFYKRSFENDIETDENETPIYELYVECEDDTQNFDMGENFNMDDSCNNISTQLENTTLNNSNSDINTNVTEGIEQCSINDTLEQYPIINKQSLYNNELEELKKNISSIEELVKNIEYRLKTTINNIDNIDETNIKRRKINYNNNGNKKQKLTSLQNNYQHNYMRIILNGDVSNYGRVVGKGGGNLKEIQEKYGVWIYVPNKENISQMPHIVIGKSRKYSFLDDAEQHILNLLTSNY